MLLGISGKTGSGKNLAASFLEGKGWRSLDLDVVAHEILNMNASLIEEEFGPDIVDDKGEVNRRILGLRVFNQPELLQKLELITYPLIEKKTDEWIAENLVVPAAIHAVNLHRISNLQRFNAFIWVYSPRAIRRKRVIAREGRPWKDLKGRFKSQNGLNSKLYSPYAETYRVGNSGKPEQLESRLEEILRQIEG